MSEPTVSAFPRSGLQPAVFPETEIVPESAMATGGHSRPFDVAGRELQSWLRWVRGPKCRGISLPTFDNEGTGG